MAMRKLLLSDDYPTDYEIRSLLMEEPTSDGNNTHGGALMSNQQIADETPAGTLHHQKGCFLQPNHQMVNVGQVGLNQSGAGATCPPNGLTIGRTTVLPPEQVQLVRYQVLRNQVVRRISTREFVSIPSQGGSIPNTNPRFVYQTITKTQLLAPTHQTLTEGQKPLSCSNPNDFLRNHEGFTEHSVPFPQTTQQGNTIHPSGPKGPSSRGVPTSGSRANQFKTPSPANQVIPSHQLIIDEQKPTTLERVHGPYACLKCGEMFITTLCYAAHEASHYQAEKRAKLMSTKARVQRAFYEQAHLVRTSYGQAKGSGQNLNMKVKEECNQN